MEWNASEHPVSWFRKTYLEGSLEIKPPYQRKPVWAGRQKCRLIETILMNLPIPEIFIQQSTSAEGETTYAIVDGQQRIRTVLQFIGADRDPDEQEVSITARCAPQIFALVRATQASLGRRQIPISRVF